MPVPINSFVETRNIYHVSVSLKLLSHNTEVIDIHLFVCTQCSPFSRLFRKTNS